MNDDLRNGLWNVLDLVIWSKEGFLLSRVEAFSRDLWFHYFKKPIDTRPRYVSEILSHIRNHFFKSPWNEVYDFLEFVVQNEKENHPNLAEYLNFVLEQEVAGYRLVAGVVTDITSEQEVAMLEEALADSQFAGVTEHLHRALELFSSRDAPDYRNSIKESISAVEGMAKLVTGDDKAMLPDALKLLDKRDQLHPALREGFIRLYGYTSDEDGIRHAMLDLPSLGADDARFFLLSCTAFVNYLKSRMK